MKALLLVGGVVLAVVVTGCGGGGDVGDTSRDLEGAWQLASGTAQDAAIEAGEGHRITLVLEDGAASGSSGCNSYSGSATITGDHIRLSELAGTEMACEAEVMAAEKAYLQALQEVDGIRAVGGRLVLSGQSTELRFDPLPPVPAEELLETKWELETVIEGSTASAPVGDDATLRVDNDGTIEGSTGCRSFTGKYVFRGDEVVVTELSMEEKPVEACGAEAREQDGIVGDVVGDGFQAKGDGDRLTLTSSGAYRLIYRSR